LDSGELKPATGTRNRGEREKCHKGQQTTDGKDAKRRLLVLLVSACGQTKTAGASAKQRLDCQTVAVTLAQ
jgi:hypothetical protein